MGVFSDALLSLDFEYFITVLYLGDWFTYVFPFLLVYAVVFTILNKVELFKNRKPTKVIIALVFSLFAIAFPVGDGAYCRSGPSGPAGSVVGYGCTLGDVIATLFPGVTAFAMGVLALYIVAAMLGIDLMKFFGNNDPANNVLKYILGGLGVIVVAYYYAKGMGWINPHGASDFFLWEILGDPLLWIIIVFGLFFFWVTKDDDEAAARERLKKIDEGEKAKGA